MFADGTYTRFYRDETIKRQKQKAHHRMRLYLLFRFGALDAVSFEHLLGWLNKLAGP